jgi:hypothetical protein
MSDSDEHRHQIVSYWTAERIRSAQPESDIDFTMSSKERAQAIVDYWTPERVAAAQPEEHAYGIHIEDEAEIEMVQGAGSLKIVPDDKVKTFPYESVGKLFYTKVGPSGSRDVYATAWVANMSTIRHVVYTAAHILKRGDMHAEKIIFIPGFIPPNTYPFGRYPQIQGSEGTAWAVDPNWNPNNPEAKYDQGLVKLDKDTTTGKYVDEVVVPIQISSNQQYTSSTEWNTIGYPVPSSQNPNGKMCERTGTFNTMLYDAVYKFGTLPKGTSGGPWILANSQNSSNGVQAGNRDSIGSTISPYFHSSSEELVKFFKFKPTV